MFCSLFKFELRTIADPESPEDLLYFMFIEINIDDVRELQKITKLELSGQINAECLAAFTKAVQISCACYDTV